jgi:signal transduction histidine kinase
MQKCERVIIEDITQSPIFTGQRSLDVLLEAGVRAVLSTPLIDSNGNILGMISTHFCNPHRPAERELRLLDLLARQAADYIQRKRAEHELRESETWARGQKEAFQVAMNGAPLSESLAILNSIALKQLGDGARCAFFLTNAARTQLFHVTGMDERYAQCVDGFKVGPESIACGLAVSTGKPAITPDVREDARWKPWLWLAEEHGYRACWSFPVETSSGTVVGTFAMYFREPREATARDRELASVLTRTASIIISRFQEAEALRKSEQRYRNLSETLETQVRARTHDLERRNAAILARTEQVRELSAQLLHSQDEERKRLARELHDDLGQQTAVVEFTLKRIQDSLSENANGLGELFGLLSGQVDDLAHGLRAASHRLHPSVLENLGLATAMRMLVEEQRRQNEEVSFIERGNSASLAPACTTALYRIAQEALRNAAKHAPEAPVRVTLIHSEDDVELRIEDAGGGFDPRMIQGKGGLGLLSMEERARSIGAAFVIDPTVGEGTSIRVRVPLEKIMEPVVE